MTWKEAMGQYMSSKEYKELERRVLQEYRNGTIFPPKDMVYNAMKLTPFDEIKCVILGQDPYHDDGQAMGLSFSVPQGVKVPPSLKNIYKELQNEFGYDIPETGDLTAWAEQGVLLLNAILTVKAHQPASHKGIGWEQYTDEVLKVLNKKEEPIVFMLWGNFAKEKSKFLNNPKHLVLTSAHPSPFSCTKFFGNNHFKKCNEFLEKNHIDPIDWSKH